MQALEAEHLDAGDRAALQSQLKTNKTELLRLSKVQGYCQTLLTNEFYKKVKIEHEDGTKTTDQVLVSEDNANKIKESVMTALQKYCHSNKFATEEEKEGKDVSFAVNSELRKLEIDEPEGIRSFMNAFENRTLHAIEEKNLAISGTGNSSSECSSDTIMTVRNKETLIVHKIIKPFCLDDDVDLYISLLQDFETMWRTFFLESVRPLHMPPHWRVDYKHTTTTSVTI
jgi:hypothetical protein